MGGLGRLIFWDYERGSWQYDIICILILAFIFLTPRDFFHDQPKAASVLMLPPDQNTNLFWIDTNLLSGVAEKDWEAKATSLVNARFKTHTTVTNVKSIEDGEGDITGYVAYTRP
jgi:hypothetical protein